MTETNKDEMEICFEAPAWLEWASRLPAPLAWGMALASLGVASLALFKVGIWISRFAWAQARQAWRKRVPPRGCLRTTRLSPKR